jgi:hypothetical protein
MLMAKRRWESLREVLKLRGKRMTNAEFKKGLEERTLAFSVRLLDYLSLLPNKKVFWLIIDQVGRSGASVGANYREANRQNQKRILFTFRTSSMRCLLCVNL